MTTSSVSENIIYGLGEGGLVSDATMLSYALRWANAAYRDIMNRYQFKHITKRTIFRTTAGQQTYHLPTDFLGFITIKDEQNDEIIEQLTPEEFARRTTTNHIDDETWTSDLDTAVSLDNQALVQYSETVSDGTTTYTRDTDYTMDYANGTITAVSGQSLSDATSYYIDYTYYEEDKPGKFTLEYDSTNSLHVMRFDPVPDAEYIMSNLYPAAPSALSDSVNPVWDRLEFCLERGGIYYGSLEMVEDPNKRMEFKTLYEQSIVALMQIDADLVPKRDRIQVALKRTDYFNGFTQS